MTPSLLPPQNFALSSFYIVIKCKQCSFFIEFRYTVMSDNAKTSDTLFFLRFADRASEYIYLSI